MKIINETEAVKLIKDNDTLGIGTSSAGWTVPEALLKKLGEVYHKEKHPKNLTLSVAITPGAFSNEKLGINHLTEEGLVGKLISAHVNAGKTFAKCISSNQFPTYTIPLGIYGKLLRSSAAGEIGYLTHIGLNTFADPRLEGCKANKKATEDIVQLVNINGKEQLLYKSYPIDICFIRASYADKQGNISFEKEPIKGDQVTLAAAVHNQGGIVVVQVNKIINHIKTKEVAIHKSLVDYVVVCNDIYSYIEEYPKYTSKLFENKKYKINLTKKIMNLNSRKICARRAILELNFGDVINLGVGMPETVAKIADEEGISSSMTLSVEMGALGGIPLGGKAFGVSLHPEAIMNIIHTMDLYDGGYLDATILGLAEIDKAGNVNVSKFNERLAGPGGFIDISQTTKKVIFIGTFTSIGLKEKVENNKLRIIEEGKVIKFKKKVDQITFSAKEAINQKVLYITERAVFELTKEGVTLIEIAPGIDLKKDILSKMEFEPIISRNLTLMDDKIFLNQLMGLSTNTIVDSKKKNYISVIKKFANFKKESIISAIYKNIPGLRNISNSKKIGG